MRTGPAAKATGTRRPDHSTGPGIILAVIDTARARWTALTGALVCSGLFVALAVLIGHHWSPLVDADHHLARQPFRFASDHTWLADTAQGVAVATEPNYVVLV